MNLKLFSSLLVCAPLAVSAQVSLVIGGLNTNITAPNLMFYGSIPGSGQGATNAGSGTISASIWQQDSFVAANPTTNANGVITYTVTSSMNGPSATNLRLYLPTSPAAGVAHRFIMCLPVEPDPQTNWGEGIEYFRTTVVTGPPQTNMPNCYNATIVEPEFQTDSVEGDNWINPAYHYESFVVNGVVPWVRANFATTGSEGMYLIGFSKSGFGAFSLISRHPSVFNKAACWDWPALASGYASADGGGWTYGTPANFTNNYQLTTNYVKGCVQFFTASPRVWLSADNSDAGYNLGDVLPFATNYLAPLGFQYYLDDPTTAVTRLHRWDSGWVTNAAAFLGQ